VRLPGEAREIQCLGVKLAAGRRPLGGTANQQEGHGRQDREPEQQEQTRS
jgi:hypothetical protein